MARNSNTATEQQKTNSGRGSLTPVEAQRKIRDIAHKLFEKRGRVSGHELEDWLEAERIVKKTS
jgi:hypothetical protein